MAFLHPYSKRSEGNIRKARALGYTCYQMFKSTASGLAANKVNFSDKADFVVENEQKQYKLRPEVVEALYYLHEVTGDPIYV